MSVQRTPYGKRVAQIKDAVRTLQEPNAPATEREVFDSLRQTTDQPFADLKQTYEELRKRGEIYSFEDGRYVVVKITDDVV